MSSEPDVHELLAPMREREVSLEAPEFHVDRARVLARMARVADARGTERLRWPGYAALAAAAAVLVFVGAYAWRAHHVENASLEVAVSRGSAIQSNGSTSIELGPRATRIPAAGKLETGHDSTTRVRTAEGLQIQLASETKLEIAELAPSSNRVALARGSIRCSVPHGKTAQPFRVVTARATIVDVGTVFSVSVNEAQETRVTVEEGEIRVESAGSETSVHAPGSWSSEQAVSGASAAPSASVTPDASPAPSASAVLPVSPNISKAHPSAKPTASVAVETTLAAESQLLRQGLSAERQGHPSDAIAAFNQLLSQYPNSPLAPDARAALARVKASSHE